jgi:hypothetical protein
MNAATAGVKIVGPGRGRGFLRSIGVRWLIDGVGGRQRFSSSSTDAPRALAAPIHLHTREEYSFVLEGRWVLLATSRRGGAGDRSGAQPVATFRPGDEPCRILEIISPAGFGCSSRSWSPGRPDQNGSRGAGRPASATAWRCSPRASPLIARFGVRSGSTSPAAGGRASVVNDWSQVD